MIEVQNDLKIYKKDNRKYTFMIVDDSPFIWKQLKRVLSLLDGEVVGEAPNGKKAIELYQQLKPDIVTCDITMPEMDGITALKEIKKIDANANVIMVTSVGWEDKVRQCILSGAANFIVKPFNLKEAAQKIYDTIKRVYQEEEEVLEL